jgi:hypothetical protein
MGQRRHRHVVLHMRALGLLAAQKLPARRQVVEQLANLDRGSGGVTGGFDFEDPAAVDDDLGGFGRIAFAVPGGEVKSG